MTPERPLVRLPLQVGTTSTWAVARAAIALAPGLVLTVFGVWLFLADSGGELAMAIGIAGFLGVLFAGFYMKLALRTRASDLLIFRDHLRVDGGSMHGTEIPWQELGLPWSDVSQTEASRLRLWRLPLTAISAIGGGDGWEPDSKVPIWKLKVNRNSTEITLAETDREDEAHSFRAASATIDAIASGKREVETAAMLPTDHATCSECNAPLLPDDAATVECRYCHATVALAEKFRERAASIKAKEASRARAKRIIEALIEQPGATRTNLVLALFAVLMFAAWPVGWYAFARHVIHDGVHGRDLGFFFLPIAGVLGGFLFARARLADRRAMQLLTLGYGALAPVREGEPSRCRRCLGPLPEVHLGGVSTCLYCGADSIVGIDLRPVIDKDRSEEQSFDSALRARRWERIKWAVLTFVSLGVLAAWIIATAKYLER